MQPVAKAEPQMPRFDLALWRGNRIRWTLLIIGLLIALSPVSWRISKPEYWFVFMLSGSLPVLD